MTGTGVGHCGLVRLAFLDEDVAQWIYLGVRSSGHELHTCETVRCSAESAKGAQLGACTNAFTMPREIAKGALAE